MCMCHIAVWHWPREWQQHLYNKKQTYIIKKIIYKSIRKTSLTPYTVLTRPPTVLLQCPLVLEHVISLRSSLNTGHHCRLSSEVNRDFKWQLKRQECLYILLITMLMNWQKLNLFTLLFRSSSFCSFCIWLFCSAFSFLVHPSTFFRSVCQHFLSTDWPMASDSTRLADTLLVTSGNAASRSARSSS